MSVTVANIKVKNGLLIGGEWVAGRGPALETVNPATEEVITTLQTASKEDVDLAVAAARECFETRWGTEVSGQVRGQLLFKLADALEAATDEIAMLEALDAGKPIEWCKADISDSAACLRYFAGAADKIHGTAIEIDDKEKYVIARKEPVGVVAQIVPWNYPILMMAWKIAPALAAGCAIVFKPAENTSLSTLKFAEVFETVGYPKGVFNVVTGYGHITGDALSKSMDVDKIAFTGSTATGRRIAVAAAQSNLKKVTLELGGKSANIVFKGANLAEAAKWAAFGIFENMGQSCTAGSRILVEDSIHDEFVKLFKEAAESFVLGDPLDPETFQGPQVSKVQFEKIMDFINETKANGKAKVLTGGERHGTKGYFVKPTLFTDVTMDMRIAKEEVFGPVGVIIRFKDEEEAVKIANSTEYGLAAAVHTQDAAQINRVSRLLKAGTVWINQYTLVSHQAPFGGFKASGWGRELGLEGIEGYLQTKSVHHYYGGPLDWPIKL